MNSFLWRYSVEPVPIGIAQIINKMKAKEKEQITLDQMRTNTIDIRIQKEAFVKGIIYDHLKNYEKENNCFLEGKYRTLFRTNIYNQITRMTLIDMVTKVALIVFLDHNGYRVAEFEKTDIEPYHDYLVRQYKQKLNKNEQ